MSAQAWIALATVTAFVTAQGLTFAFLLGGLFPRVKRLEGYYEDKNALAVGMATLTAEMAP